MYPSLRLRASVLGLLSSVCLASCLPPTEVPTPLRPAQSAQDETRSLVESVQRSGEVAIEVKEVVNQAANAAFAQTFPSTPEAQYTVGASCFHDGCLQHVIYRDVCAARAADDVLLRRVGAPLRKWPGPVYKTPGIPTGDGRVDVTWALLLSKPEKQRPALDALIRPPPPPPPITLPDICRQADAGGKPVPPPAPAGRAPAPGLVNPIQPRAK